MVIALPESLVWLAPLGLAELGVRSHFLQAIVRILILVLRKFGGDFFVLPYLIYSGG